MNTKSRDEAYPRLETERLVLRALRLDDADFIFQEWGDAVVTYYMWDEDPLASREQAEEMLRPLQTPDVMPNFKWWGIELKAEGRLIGTCGYCRWDRQHHRAEIGYDLWPDYWGQGLMPEALRALLRYGFTEMGLNRAEATTHTDNRQSQRVLAKLGFQREGVLRAYYRRGSAYTDQVAFSLLRSEWSDLGLVEE